MTALVFWALPVLAQAPATTPPAQPPVKPDAEVAATVNGQPILEATVQKALKEKGQRAELLNFLIDNMAIDQALVQMQIGVEKNEIDKRLEDITAEIKKDGKGKDLPTMFKELNLTEAEFRQLITADMRWDKYATAQATDKAVRELFDNNKEMFDNSMVRARHILLTPPPGDAKAALDVQAQLLGFKKQVEDKVAAGLAKLPASTDALAKEKARTSLMDEEFAAIAREKSACPSKSQGGDVNWFQRAGFMVEPFAKTAFALKPYQMSDVVQTPFGYHLILVTDRKPGRDIKFEDVKDDVKEIFCERLRENLAAQVRAKSKIVINPAPKP